MVSENNGKPASIAVKDSAIKEKELPPRLCSYAQAMEPVEAHEDKTAFNTIESDLYKVRIETNQTHEQKSDGFRTIAQKFRISVVTPTYEGIEALERLAQGDCRGCAVPCKVIEGWCIFHDLPPHEYIRSFCSSNANLRPDNCRTRDSKKLSCCESCDHWEIIQRRITEELAPWPGSGSSGPLVQEWTEEVVFRERRGPQSGA